MIKKTVFIMMSFFMALSVNAQELNGKWHFEVTDAPYGYQTGTVEFKNADKRVTAKVNIGYDTFTADIQKKKENTYVCHMYIEGSNVNVTFITKKGKIKATAEANGMVMDVKLTRAKKE